MRINRYVALTSGLSRRQADKAIEEGRVMLDQKDATTAIDIGPNQIVTLDGKLLEMPFKATILINKPVGYVVSRKGQGSKTIYDLLPPDLLKLKPIGRLDKNSSGLLLLTNDGQLNQQLTHPSFNKPKVYEVTLNKILKPYDQDLLKSGVELSDGLSKLMINKASNKQLTLTLYEGRNRQIRRTFDALGYKVIKLNRTSFGDYQLNELKPGEYRLIS